MRIEYSATCGGLRSGNDGGLAGLPDLALARVGAAALDDELPEDLVRGQNLLRLGQVLGDVGDVVPDASAQRLLHVVEVRAQVVDAEGAGEVRLVAPREQLGHVAEVAQPVVDRRRRQHEERLRPHRVVEQVEELVVARRLDSFVSVAPAPRVAEVMGLVDDHDVGELGDPAEALREVALAAEVGVAEDGEVAEVGAAADAADVRQPLAQVRLPDAFLRRLRSEQHDALALVQDQPLDQHQPDEGLAETDAVAEEGAAVLAGDLHQRPVGLLLVAVEPGEHLRAGLVPLGRGQLVAAEELLQRLRVDVERRVETRVARRSSR